MEEDPKILEVDIEGKNKELWAKVKSKLIKSIDGMLDTVIDFKSNSTIRDEAEEFISELISYGKAKLRKAGLQNEQIIADIEYKFSQRQKEFSEARLNNAQASKIEFEIKIKQMELSLKLTRAMLIGEEGKEEIIFMKRIDGFLEALNSIEK